MLNDNTLSLYHKYTSDEEVIIDDLQTYDLVYDFIQYKAEGGILNETAFMNIQEL